MDQQQLTVQQAIHKIVGQSNLTRAEARDVMSHIMEGGATPTQIGAMLTGLRMKGETIEEITGFAETMRAKANRVQTRRENLLDTCGTGGDGADTFNISTTAAIVAAAGGRPGGEAWKPGDVEQKRQCGCARSTRSQHPVKRDPGGSLLEEVGICFMFAQLYHQSMKHVAASRRELGFRTVFNLLGPLTNPAGADRQVLGVFDRGKTETIAHVMLALGVKRSLVVASLDGLDEISISDATQVTELKDGGIRTFEITPEELGLKVYSLKDVVGGDAAVNAEIIRGVFSGAPGACRDVVLANAGACFYVTGFSETLPEGVKLAAQVIDSGKAKEKLEQLVQYTGEVSHVS